MNSVFKILLFLLDCIYYFIICNLLFFIYSEYSEYILNKLSDRWFVHTFS